jgi:Ankyrin repeats (3 copies)/Zinc finger C-x8-C-x5-C-x3-H type (and similar)
MEEDFNRYGYGGFGYDTSHVPRDEEHSALYIAAKDGDLAKVQQALLAVVGRHMNEDETCPTSAVNNNMLRVKILNHARRWTEVDCMMSGFTKEYAWFDRTPLMIAIVQGHAAIVKYLLQQGADPTLAACPREDYYHVRAAQEAERAYTQAKQNIIQLKRVAQTQDDSSFLGASEFRKFLLPAQPANRSSTSSTGTTLAASFPYHVRAWDLLDAEAKAKFIQSMIQVCLKFWQASTSKNATGGASYDPKRASQLPHNMKEMIAALDALGACPVPSSKNDKEFLPQDDNHQQVLAGLQVLKQRLGQEEVQEKNALDEQRQLAQEHAYKQRVAAWRHHLLLLQQQLQLNKTQARACAFFAKGSCRNGDDCPFSHDLSSGGGGNNSKSRRRPDRSHYQGRLYEEVNFYRPDGDTEGKDIGWCLGNGFYEIEHGLWSGDWYYRHHPHVKIQTEAEKKRELAELETPLEDRKFCPVPGCKAWFKTTNELQDHITFSGGKAHRRYQREQGSISTTTSLAAV